MIRRALRVSLATAIMSGMLGQILGCGHSSGSTSSTGPAGSPNATSSSSESSVASSSAPETAAGQPGAVSQAVAAEATRIGNDPGALLSRVSDGIAYEIYPGAFRGAAGALADNAGNDVDKALLLHDLIQAADPTAQVRFATCTLSAQQQDQLIAAAHDAYKPPHVLAQDAAQLVSQTSDANILKRLQLLAGIWSGLVAQDQAETTRLASALQSANAPVKAPTPGDPHPIVANHTWVQLQQGGSWTDFDPTLPKAKPGTALCGAQQTMAQLPDSQYDTVTARVRVETRANGVANDSTLLEQTWPAASLAQKSLSFMFAEPSGVTLPTSPAPAPTGMDAYTPVFQVDGAITAGQPIFMPSIGGGLSSSVSKAASAVTSLFGPGPTPSPMTTATGPDVVGVWLQIGVGASGEQPETVDETIFDRVAYADRAAGNAATANLVALDTNDGVYLPLASVWSIGANVGNGSVGVGDLNSIDTSKATATTLVRQLGRLQHNYYQVRRALYAASHTSAPQISNVQPGISVMAFVFGPPAGADTTPSASFFMDVASDHALPSQGGSTDGVSWGVTSLLAERFIVLGQAMLISATSGGTVDQLRVGDVIGIFNVLSRQSVGTTLVRSASDVGAITAPADTKARLNASLSGGTIAFAPSATVGVTAPDQYGWWNIGQDGSVRDEMQDGRHTEGAEEGENLSFVARVAKFFCRNGRLVRGAVMAASIVGAMSGEAEGANQLAEQLRAEQELEEAIEKGEGGC
jgi:hypothetical protein